MAKMAELHAEGVTDLYSYQQGQIDKQNEIIQRLKSTVLDKELLLQLIAVVLGQTKNE